MRLIDADALIEYLDKRLTYEMIDGKNRAYGKGVRDAIKDVKEQPTIAQRTGKWVDGKCDRCGEHAPYWAMATTYYLSKFCPSCGARMEGDNAE